MLLDDELWTKERWEFLVLMHSTIRGKKVKSDVSEPASPYEANQKQVLPGHISNQNLVIKTIKHIIQI